MTQRTQLGGGAWLRIPLVILLAVASVGALGGCERRNETVGRLETQLAEYRRAPSDALAARIDASFAQLDADIAAIRADAEAKSGAAQAEELARAEALETRRGELRRDYYAARVERAAAAAKEAAKSLGDSIGKELERAGEKLRDAAGAGEGG